LKAELRLQSLLTAAAAIALAAPAASAGVPADVHALVIGNNQAPDGDLAGTVVPPLRFADDDAAAFFDLLSKISSDNHLLTVMDAETQAVWPNLAAVARPPTMAEVRTAVATIADRVKDDRRRGRQSSVFMFFSGHGAASKSGDPIFTLADGGISNQILYEEILSKIPADYVHVIIDACNAEGVVRPRTVAAQPVGISATQADAILSRSTLRRFHRSLFSPPTRRKIGEVRETLSRTCER